MATQNLLVELLVEELPPKALNKLGGAFSAVLFESLKTQGLTADNSAVTAFATPRRLAAHITNVASKAVDKQVAQKLMPASVGLDASGNATPALIKRLQALGADESAVAKLRKENDGKADVLFFDAMQTGATLKDGLQASLDAALGALPIPKVMTYQLADGWESVNFVRPAHKLVALHGETIVPVTALGLASGNTTQGHRFLSKGKITLPNADSYEGLLHSEGKVIASFDKRKALIEKLLEEKRISRESDGVIKPDSLLEEVTALVEWPVVYECHFDKEFLEVPEECLILTMQTNQKYFPCTISDALTNRFLIVSNIETEDSSAIVGGNERVVRPRLADAKFFFDQDRKKTLLLMSYGLDKVIYHNALGSQRDRVERVQKITSSIISLSSYFSADKHLEANVDLAAKLAKADLLSDMVGEFPELQGIMGRYYTQHADFGDEIAFAIEDHYKPRFAGDGLPRNKTGVILALADKLETLVGLFSIGEKPTGDKDPFALRRHALGIIRILIECQLSVSLSDLIRGALQQFDVEATDRSNMIESIKYFCLDRLQANLREQSFTAQEVEAVLTRNTEFLRNTPKYLEAVRAFSTLPEAPALAAANKRVGNILKKVEGEVKAEVKTNLLTEPAEIALNEALSEVKPQADKLFESGDYTNSLKALAALKAPVDDFFDNVMVNADDVNLKNNRLALLNQLHQAMNRVADLSKLAS